MTDKMQGMICYLLMEMMKWYKNFTAKNYYLELL